MLAGQSVREVGEQASSQYYEANQCSWICAGNEWGCAWKTFVLFLMKSGGQHLAKWIWNIWYVWWQRIKQESVMSSWMQGRDLQVVENKSLILLFLRGHKVDKLIVYYMWYSCAANTFLMIFSVRSMLHKVSSQPFLFSGAVRRKLVSEYLLDTPQFFFSNRKSSDG